SSSSFISSEAPSVDAIWCANADAMICAPARVPLKIRRVPPQGDEQYQGEKSQHERSLVQRKKWLRDGDYGDAHSEHDGNLNQDHQRAPGRIRWIHPTLLRLRKGARGQVIAERLRAGDQTVYERRRDQPTYQNDDEPDAIRRHPQHATDDN